jgi:hypothetical protein
MRELLALWFMLSAGTFLFSGVLVWNAFRTKDGREAFKKLDMSYGAVVFWTLVACVIFPLGWAWMYSAVKRRH